MAAEISSVKKRKSPGFMTLLSSAACEWFLIFLLFIDASFSYLATKFAQYCELKTPCVLCSRLDHVLGKTETGGYWSLLCTNHREEISSLVSCSVHCNLADVHGMCEECLMPVAMRHKSNSEAYRLLVGKLWVDVERSVLQTSLLNKYMRLVPSSRTTCSCCMKTLRTKSNAERLIEPTPVGFGASKASAKPPLHHVPGRSRFSRRDSLKRLRDKFTRQNAPHPSESNGIDTLSRIGYAKLKISSDSESEVPLSEDDDDEGNPGSYEKCDSKSEDDAYFSGRSRPQTPGDYVASDKPTHQVFEVKHAVPDRPNLLDLNDHKYVNSSSSDIFTEHGFRELDCAESYLETSTCLTPELITFDNGHQAPDIGGGSSGLSAETLKSNVSALSVLSELLSSYTVPSLGNTVTIPLETMNVMGTSDNGNTVSNEHIELAAGCSSDNALSSTSDNMNQTVALTQSTENRELSGMLVVDPIPVCDSVENEEDVRSPQQISMCEVGLSLEDNSLRTHDQHDTSRKHENYCSQVFSVSLVRNDSSYDSLDEINVSYIEGESTVDRLKRQVEHDRSCINSLYKELEEERNAAAVAANQAMAMITRLQEEKASLHMEALQYLRMMEEQAEYDMEALERANNLLSEKEKELQDLEAELEFYINNSHDKSAVEDQHKEKLKVEHNVTAHVENSSSTSNDSISAEIIYSYGNCESPNYENERIYISQSLKKLEKKLYQVYCCRRVDSIPNGLNSDKIEIKVENPEDLNTEKLLNEDEGSNSPVQKMMLTSNVIPSQEGASNGTHSHDKSADFMRGGDFVSEKSDKSSLSTNIVEINPGTLEKEIVELHDRLDALETDQDFLKHASNLLWNGKDGLQYIQEIAHQLQELRKVEFKKQTLLVP